ncbi:hypothetical protein A1O3_03597 [Capronia epimyces CBS 606.96]|uniref:Metallo-beta-lactamase domain-containing protein n=1 Tax=Capronia epimyces CBS 606.96 TaxID=1182542 RepID=W9YWI2_9EURO|nr:uncharacterized protein A1O3_03597 [Capronia epimyces CBS 606.96]EXJ86644.1 hypothetical protein A1O3_03597 [Capronia epimyces CBS 606.96]
MVVVHRLPSLPTDEPRAHHIGNPPSGFRNPWPSFDEAHGGVLDILKVRFARHRPAFVPVPERSELVPVRKIDFAQLKGKGGPAPGLKVTWFGHASFLVQTATASADEVEEGARRRGVNILCDPVFSDRTSPVHWAGPKRYTPTPCSLDELLESVEIDLVLISHNHYDHADAHTLTAIWARRKPHVHFLAGLHNARWLISACGIDPSCITELDWWDRVEVEVEAEAEAVGAEAHAGNEAGTTTPTPAKVQITCTPTQHFSSRSIFDRNHDLWCSYAIQDRDHERGGSEGVPGKKVYFAGDTAYRSIPSAGLSHEEEDERPTCPAFKQIGERLGPFDLALLPIGLCEPRQFMSNVHANSWDSIRIHHDIRSKKSIGMHWGTVRGGLSAQYEDVRTPPRHWRQAAEEAGLSWGEEIGLMDVGQTLVLA